MITTLVQFQLPQPLSRTQAQEIFLGTAPNYQGIPGLLRKYYIVAEDGATAGGVYLWQSRRDAEMVYTEQWRDTVTEKYGAAPSVTWFESPVVVDNVSEEILSDS
ncbi:MAG: YdhR family protein [Salinisphaera sp.]|nr:YdhR family protein [Salinisphaera sp.]MDN5937069.1 YdhR family protein [Salinisphaera sp.]